MSAGGRRPPRLPVAAAIAAASLIGWVSIGCDAGRPDAGVARRGPAPARVLPPPAGGDPRVAGLSWGGVEGDRILAVLRGDGRVDLYRPDRSGVPLGQVGRPGSTRAVAVLGGGGIATGDEAGLAVWRASGSSPPTRRGALQIGPVADVVAASGRADEGYAALRTGIVIRFRARADADAPVEIARSTVAPPPSPTPSDVRLAIVEDGRSVVVRRPGGGRVVLRSDLTEAAVGPSGGEIDSEAVENPLVARIDGGAVVLSDRGGRTRDRRFGLGRVARGVAFAERGRRLIVAQDGQFLLMDAGRADPASPGMPRVADVADGPSWVVADPNRPGDRVATGDASGVVEIGDGSTLEARSRPRPPGEIPEFAFEPRATGSGAASPGPSPRGEVGPELLGRLAGEIEAAAASKSIVEEAGSRRRRAHLLLPPLDGPAPPSTPAEEPDRVESAIEDLRLAADLFRRASPPRAREALLCDAERAWGLLLAGSPRAASAAMAELRRRAGADPFLAQVAELDAIESAIASATGRPEDAAASSSRAIRTLSGGSRDHLRESMVLANVQALATLGRWIDAGSSSTAGPDGGEVDLRRRTALRRGGVGDPGLPVGAHLIGRIAAAEGRLDRADSQLAEAIDEHRRAFRADLAAEATLERAEVLERLGRAAEAADLYRSVTVGSDDPAASARLRPARIDRGRPFRGLARCLLGTRGPSSALTAVEQGRRACWLDEVGVSRVLSSPIALTTESIPALDRLRTLRASDGPDSAAAREAERRLAHEGRLLALSDPTSAFDPSSLGLSEGEAVLAFADLGPSTLGGFLIRRDRPVEFRRIGVGRRGLAGMIRAWRRSLGDGGRATPGGDAPMDESPLTTLSAEPDLGPGTAPPVASDDPTGALDRSLIRPFDPLLAGINRLIVAPTDEIAALPIEAIGRPERVLARYRVSTIPSLSILQARRDGGRIDRATGGGRLLVARDPSAPAPAVPGTIVVAGAGARPTRLFDLAVADCGVVRVSAPATPGGRTAIRLAPEASGPWSDGFLTAADLARLPLRARVLTLDLAEPEDRGRLDAGGLMGLARGGLAAGANWVLLGLWDAPPESRKRLLDAFETGLATAAGPAEALDRARRVVARDPARRDPVHWAGYVLVGPP